MLGTTTGDYNPTTKPVAAVFLYHVWFYAVVNISEWRMIYYIGHIVTVLVLYQNVGCNVFVSHL